MIEFKDYSDKDIELMKDAWNDVLEDGVAFPGLDLYTKDSFKEYLLQQSKVTCMVDFDVLLGYYIIHPNNIGRCSHIANASYVMLKPSRGKHLGKTLVKQSLIDAKNLGFKGMQYNAVVANNEKALHIYDSLGFIRVGIIPKGFLLKNGTYSDMYVMYKGLDDI
ncbi:MAG: GNAT family N-acetyltransferase [Erysipelotrichaceae bacterium]|nr:GNAT family N-acetyltransferase [Erysipelotrichaceae bacterium]